MQKSRTRGAGARPGITVPTGMGDQFRQHLIRYFPGGGQRAGPGLCGSCTITGGIITGNPHRKTLSRPAPTIYRTMDLLLPVIIGIALSMDCFAVSLAVGTSTRTSLLNAALIIACCFGAFQAGMTLLGWGLGSAFVGLIAGYDHWVAFLLLAIIGIKMIREGLEKDDEDEGSLSALEVLPVLVLSLATSIDALAVGISFAVLRMEVLIPALIIGIVAFLISFAGVMAGMRLKELIGKRIEIAGGLILIAIGLNVVISHMA